MRPGLLAIAVILVLASSGCTSDTGEVSVKFRNLSGPEPNITLEISNTTGSSLEPDSPENETEKKTSPGKEDDHDPCADKLCDDSVTTCPDGTVQSCDNECDPDEGTCSSCIPDCSGHEEKPCELECGECEVLDHEDCECLLEFYCSGNGICTSDEWPDGEDCLEFGGCDDQDDCTLDTFDPNSQDCIHRDICCDDSDDCTADLYNETTEACIHVYSCCGNGICDEPGDPAECPEECQEGEVSGDVLISQLDPVNEIVFIEGDQVDLTNWTLQDETNTYTFPDGFVIQGEARVHTLGCPEDNNETDLYWGHSTEPCRDGPIWRNTGETATLRDSFGEIADTYTY